MKNKIIVGFGIVALIVIAIVLLVDFEDSRESPTETVAVANGDLNVSVNYGRPSVRGRVIFGTTAEQALQPFGKYWRLGANEATEITLSQDVLFAGQPIKAGSYRMYAIPGADSFQIGLNSETGQWGYDEPKYDKDVLKVTVPAEKIDTSVEQLTIKMDQSGSGIVLVVSWANSQFQIHVDPAQ
jgi:hypothetical protein